MPYPGDDLYVLFRYLVVSLAPLLSSCDRFSLRLSRQRRPIFGGYSVSPLIDLTPSPSHQARISLNLHCRSHFLSQVGFVPISQLSFLFPVTLEGGGYMAIYPCGPSITRSHAFPAATDSIPPLARLLPSASTNVCCLPTPPTYSVSKM